MTFLATHLNPPASQSQFDVRVRVGVVREVVVVELDAVDDRAVTRSADAFLTVVVVAPAEHLPVRAEARARAAGARAVVVHGEVDQLPTLGVSPHVIGNEDGALLIRGRVVPDLEVREHHVGRPSGLDRVLRRSPAAVVRAVEGGRPDELVAALRAQRPVVLALKGRTSCWAGTR